MRARSVLGTLIVASLVASVVPSYSAPAPKAGAVCKKSGVTQSYNGKVFTCKKSGKKLVWGKGKAIKKAAPIPVAAPSPTPSPIPQPSVAPSPQPTPLPTRTVQDSLQRPGLGTGEAVMTGPGKGYVRQYATNFNSYRLFISDKDNSSTKPYFDTGIIDSSTSPIFHQFTNLGCGKNLETVISFYSGTGGTGQIETLNASNLKGYACAGNENAGSFPTTAVPTINVNARNSAVSSPIESCRLKDQRKIKTQRNNVGFPLLTDLLPTKGTLNLALVPIDFSDAPGDASFMANMKDQMKKVQDWYRDFSQGKLKVEVKTSDRWFRAPKISSEYATGKGQAYQANNFAQEWDSFAQEFINSTGSAIDYSDVHGIFFYFPPNSKYEIVSEIMGRGIDLMTPQGKKNLFYFGPGKWVYEYQQKIEVPYSRFWTLFIHELLHSQSLPLHGAGNGWPTGLSNNQEYGSASLDPWQSFLLGWLEDSQVFCAQLSLNQEVTIALEPVEVLGRGTRMAVIPLTSQTALVIESRRPIGYSSEWAISDWGSLVYIVDVTKDSDRSAESSGDWGNEVSWSKWSYYLLPEGRKSWNTKTDEIGTFAKYRPYLIKPGDKLTFDGIEISGVESGDLDVVRIKRTGVSQGVEVGSATGIIRPTEKLPAKVTSLNSIGDGVQSVTYWSWQGASARVKNIDNNYNRDFKLDVRQGPNTKLTNQEPRKAMELASKLWNSFPQPMEVVAIYYTFRDREWAQAQFNSIALKPKGNEATNSCPSEANCVGAQAEVDLKGKGVMLFAVSPSSAQDINKTSGTVEAHEFTHLVQGSNFIGKPRGEMGYCCSKAYIPWWYVEGIAQFTQAASIYYDSYDSYLAERKRTIQGLKSLNLSQKWIEDYILATDTNVWKNTDRWREYDIGFLAIELLASYKNANFAMQIFFDVATGFSFESAFEKSYEMKWQDAGRALANYVYKAINSP